MESQFWIERDAYERHEAHLREAAQGRLGLRSGRSEDPRRRRRALVIVALVFGAVLLAVETAGATPGVGLRRTVLAQATVDAFRVRSDDIQMFALNRADIVTQQVTVDVGGDTGWHTHFGPAFVLVKSGSFSLTHASGCVTQTYQAGEGFVEGPNDVHIGRNVGDMPVEIVATYANVPIGGEVAQSADAPAACQ